MALQVDAELPFMGIAGVFCISCNCTYYEAYNITTRNAAKFFK